MYSYTLPAKPCGKNKHHYKHEQTFMRKHFLIASLLIATISVTAQTKKATVTVAKPKPKPVAASGVNPLKSPDDSLSYAFGISLGEYFQWHSIPLNNASCALMLSVPSCPNNSASLLASLICKALTIF